MSGWLGKGSKHKQFQAIKDKKSFNKSKTKTMKTKKEVAFNAKAVIEELAAGINHRAIMPANHFVNHLGFNKTVIKTLTKTYYSESEYPGKQIYTDGIPVSQLTGVLYYDFLVWLADTLGIDKDAGFTGGGRQPYSWMLRDKILLKLQGQ